MVLSCLFRPMIEANFGGPLVPLLSSSYTSILRIEGTATPSPSKPAMPHSGGGSGGREGERTEEVSILCWNLLAPPYRRVAGGRESDGSDWKERVSAQIEYVARADADIVALQEFWVANSLATSMWEEFALHNQYAMFVSPRTSGKEDGCCLLLKMRSAGADNSGCGYACKTIGLSGGLTVGNRAGLCPEAEVLTGMSSLSFNDWGNRIVQSVEVCARTQVAQHHSASEQGHATFMGATCRSL
eukprot:scaffold74545_cov37-Tisochrysis_lutea.AAC.4